MRDINERGRTLDGVLHQYEKFVKPSFEEFIFPVCTRLIFFLSHTSLSMFSVPTITSLIPDILFQTKKYADVIIPRGVDNQVLLVSSSLLFSLSSLSFSLSSLFLIIFKVAINLLVQHIRSKLDERDPRNIMRGKASNAYFYDSDEES